MAISAYTLQFLPVTKRLQPAVQTVCYMVMSEKLVSLLQYAGHCKNPARALEAFWVWGHIHGAEIRGMP